MRQCYLLLVIVISTLYFQVPANAQAPAAPPAGATKTPGGPGRPNMPQIGHLYGKLLDSKTGKPIEYASVSLRRQKDSSVVTGMLTKNNGDFSLDNLPFGAFILRIDFMGYTSLYKKVTISPQTTDQDLGNIKMQPNVKTLGQVEVTGQKSAFTMGIDKKIFNVDRNLVSVGGTAADVLKNVPSVNVDLDGNVTVRNAAPTVFVDGKPSTLTLDQIPADAIESVELITNPSARYDAEGMSGILNIVLKKNRKAGMNGMVMAGIGNGDKYNGGGNINIRQGKVNVFANYNINSSQNWSEGTTDRTNILPGKDTNYLHQRTDGKSQPLFQFGRFGLDYFLDNRNTISISQHIVAGKFKNSEDLRSEFSGKDKVLRNVNDRLNNNTFGFNNYATQLGFKHIYAKPGKEWTADAGYNYSTNDRNGEYITQNKDVNGNPVGQPLRQQNNSDGKTTFITVQTDYVEPIGTKGKLELGAKGTFRNYTSIYKVFDQDPATGKFNFVDSLSNDYEYKEKIYAGYANFSSAIGNFGYQAGLRVEQYIYEGQIPSKGMNFEPTKAKPGLFPSVYLSQKLEKEQELQLNYSRRVNRPNFFQLIPYRDYTDPQNQREGNPNLKPEYTNSFEFSYSKNWKTNNFLASLYFRNTNNLMSTVSTPIGKDTLLTTYVNANRNNTYGAELTMKNQLIKGWDITTNVNLYQTELKVNSNGQDFDNKGFSWMAKLNSETKLPANFTFQVNATYQAPAIALPTGGSRGGGGGRGTMMMMTPASAQGTIKGFSSVDVAIRKDFLKNKAASITLSLSDIFNTNQFEQNLETPTFLQDYMRKRESRILRLNFSYRFGKMDMQLFKRKNRNQGTDSQMGEQMQTF